MIIATLAVLIAICSVEAADRNLASRTRLPTSSDEIQRIAHARIQGLIFLLTVFQYAIEQLNAKVQPAKREILSAITSAEAQVWVFLVDKALTTGPRFRMVSVTSWG